MFTLQRLEPLQSAHQSPFWPLTPPSRPVSPVDLVVSRVLINVCWISRALVPWRLRPASFVHHSFPQCMHTSVTLSTARKQMQPRPISKASGVRDPRCEQAVRGTRRVRVTQLTRQWSIHMVKAAGHRMETLSVAFKRQSGAHDQFLKVFQ